MSSIFNEREILLGPLLAWRRTSLRAVARAVAWPAAAALVAGGVLIAIGAGSSVPGLVAYTFCVFVLASIIFDNPPARIRSRISRSLFSGKQTNAIAVSGFPPMA